MACAHASARVPTQRQACDQGTWHGPNFAPYPRCMSEFAQFSVEEDAGGGASLVLSGPWRLSTIGDVDQRLPSISVQVARIDLSAITEIDTVDRKSTRLNSSHSQISYAVFCL